MNKTIHICKSCKNKENDRQSWLSFQAQFFVHLPSDIEYSPIAFQSPLRHLPHLKNRPLPAGLHWHQISTPYCGSWTPICNLFLRTHDLPWLQMDMHLRRGLQVLVGREAWYQVAAPALDWDWGQGKIGDSGWKTQDLSETGKGARVFSFTGLLAGRDQQKTHRWRSPPQHSQTLSVQLLA